jgi:hypothetical protein
MQRVRLPGTQLVVLIHLVVTEVLACTKCANASTPVPTPAEELGYFPVDMGLADEWQVIAPRKIFFLYSAGRKVPVKALAGSDSMDELTAYNRHVPQDRRGLDWFAPEVRTCTQC